MARSGSAGRDAGKLTIEEFERLLDDGWRRDLVGGRVVREPPAGWEHGEIAARLCALVWNFVRERGLGRVFAAETGFVLSEEERTVRGPDLAFVAEDRVPAGEVPKNFARIAPDLAVEVVSPSNSWTDVASKVRDYLEAEVRLVWIVDPPRRTVSVHRSGAPPRVLEPDQHLEGEDLLPGFRVEVGSLFPN